VRTHFDVLSASTARITTPSALIKGSGNELIAPLQPRRSVTGEVVETEWLGGLLRSYQRAAA